MVAVNDVWEPGTLAHLLAYDSTFGRLRAEVGHDDKAIVVDGHRIRALREPDPARLPWKELDVDLVIEATGSYARATRPSCTWRSAHSGC